MNEEAATHDTFRDKSLETFQDTKKPLTDPNLSKTLNQTSAIIDKSASTDSVNDHSIINTNGDKNVTQIPTNSSVLDNDLTKAKKKEPPQNHDKPGLSTKVDTISQNSIATFMKQDKDNTMTQNDDTSRLEDDLDMLLSIDKPKTAQKPVLNSQNVNKVHVAKHAFVNGSDKPKGEFYHALQNMPMQYSKTFFSEAKIENFIGKILIFLFWLNIHCGYMLEPPRRGCSNKYPQCMFWIKNKKNRYTSAAPVLLYKLMFKGYSLH